MIEIREECSARQFYALESYLKNENLRKVKHSVTIQSLMSNDVRQTRRDNK